LFASLRVRQPERRDCDLSREDDMRTAQQWSMRSRIRAAAGLLAGVLALLATPAAASAGPTERVSVDSAGNEVYRWSAYPAISADGRFVAFSSYATHLVPEDTNQWTDVFVYDRQTRATERVSVDSAGNQGDGSSEGAAAISADGRFVTFASFSTNLVPGDTNGAWDVFVYDRQTRTTERVSVDSAGNQANRESSTPTISADGRFVAFSSRATNLVPGANGGVFIHDRQTRTTELVSVDGAASRMSADGRFIAFVSSAANLVPGDTNGREDVFVHDRQTRTTERVSVATDGTQGNNFSTGPSISADGRFVAFYSRATNLVPGDTNGCPNPDGYTDPCYDVFVHDRQTGTTERVSVDSAGSQGNSDSSGPGLSADGRFVAFLSRASNLVPGDTNGYYDVFVHDRQTRTTERVSVDSAGTQGNSNSDRPSISADGRFVAFGSAASNLVPGDTNGQYDVFVHDRAPAGPDATPPVRANGQPLGRLPAGTAQATLSLATNYENATCRYSTTPGVAYEAMTATFATTGGTAHATPVGGLSDGGSYAFYVRCQDAAGNANADDYPISFSIAAAGAGGTTERVSVDSAGIQGSASSFTPSISADGRFVAFASRATNLVPGDTNTSDDVFVHDRQTGTTERVSVDSAGTEGNGPSVDPAISADGRFVAFISIATNLVPGGTSGRWHVFVRDRQTGITEQVSVDSAGNQGDWSYDPAISADGRFVAFQSYATNLVPGDTNGAGDVFVHDRQTRTTERLSVDSAGTGGNGLSVNPSISADGRFVVFYSYATNLVPGDTNGAGDVFVHDRQTGTTERVSVDSAGTQGNSNSDRPSISADGRFVAFSSSATNLAPGDTGGQVDLFVHDRQTRTTERASVDSAGNQGNEWSIGPPALSADGRFVAFLSLATNLVPGDSNGWMNVFVRDRQARTTERVSVDGAGTEGNESSDAPSISADGRFVAFTSAAFNLVPGDTNWSADVFVHDRGDVGNQDTTAPVRSNGQPSGTQPAGTTQTTLSLVTNENATCRYNTTPGVAYGTMTASFGTTGGTAHRTPVGGLSNGGSYRFYVRCEDAAGNANPNDFIIAFSVATSVTTTTVNFDSPAPPGGPGPLNGVFQGIDFGIGQWAWSGPYNVDPTNNVYFANSTGTSRTFAFSPAPRVLQSLRVYASGAGTMTLSDDAGQTLSRSVTTGSMQLVTTGWTRPASTVTVSFTMGWSLGIDDITYTTAP
jgi:Tol biopolymer transport system component